jgi:hypothetical protein
VWVAEQSDTRAGFGGQILIYQGADLAGPNAANATPVRIDLGAETADLCRTATGANPVRPHMMAFTRTYSHAVLSFVASGHVVIFEAASRKPLTCMQTTVSETTKTRQAHAAFPAPDGSYILVANQNGKAAGTDRHRPCQGHVHAQRGGHARPRDVHHAERPPV